MAGTAIAKTNYSHEAVIDAIIATPGITQRQLAAQFGYTEGWMSQIMNSDAFQNMLATRKSEIIDPIIKLSFEEKIKGLAAQSLEVIQEKLELQRSGALAARALDITTRALGYGARGPQVQVNNYVAVVPPKAVDAASWAETYTPTPAAPRVIDG